MGSNNSKRIEINKSEINDKIKKINELTKSFIFINKTNLFLEFFLVNNKKINVIIMDYNKNLGVFDTVKRVKRLEIDVFYKYYNTLMNSLDIFVEKIIEERVSKLSEEERLNFSTEENGLCPLCFEKKVNFSLPCSHFFCEDCIKTWMVKSETCPLCRTQFKCNTKTPAGIKGSDRWIFIDSKIDQDQMKQYNEEILLFLTNKLFQKK